VLCPAGAGQADSFDTRDTDRRRLMTAQDAINRRMGRDGVFSAGAGIHRERKAFAAPVVLILPELRHSRSESLANTHAQPSLAELIRFVGNRLEPSWTLRKTGRRNRLTFQLQEGHPRNLCRLCHYVNDRFSYSSLEASLDGLWRGHHVVP
jgi:hypothetical protein